MSFRSLNSLIPSEFQRLDTRTNAADSFANVRDLQVIRKNHNILLARRCRNTVLTTRIGLETGSDGISFGGLRPVDAHSGGRVISLPYFSQNPYLKELTVAVYGLGDASYPSYLYLSITADGAAPQIEDSVRLTFDSGSVGWETLDVPIKRDVRRAALKTLHVIYQTPEGADATKTAGTVVDVGDKWAIVTDSSGMSVGDMLISNSTGVEPRIVLANYSNILGGTNDKVYVTEPWNIRPSIGSTLTPRTMKSVAMYSLCAYEDKLSTFGGDTDWNYFL